MKSTAKLISIAAHPLLMPAYALAYLFCYGTPWGLLPESYKGLVSIFTLCGTCILPLVACLVMRAVGLVATDEMDDKRERTLPIVFGLISVATTLAVARNSSIVALPEPVLAIILAELAMLTLAFVITPTWKISLHAMAVGAMLTFVTYIGQLSMIDFSTAAIAIFAASGIVAWARLYSQAHTPEELLAGYLTGVVSMFLALIYSILGL